MDAEVKKLIKQQQQDDFSDHVSKDSRKVSVDPMLLVKISDDIQIKKEAASPATWGLPAKIASVREDRTCGCGENTKNVTYEQTRLISGLEFNDGSCLCGNCGFAY